MDRSFADWPDYTGSIKLLKYEFVCKNEKNKQGRPVKGTA
jgi:hypothetical protein